MRIAILFDSFCLGGAEYHAFKLARFLNSIDNIEAQIWVLSEGDGTIKKLCDEFGIKTRVLEPFTRIQRFLYFKQIRHFGKYFRDWNTDVVISFNKLPNLLNALVSKKSGIKLSIWSEQSINMYTIENNAVRKAISNIDFFVSNARHISNHLESQLSLPSEKMYVVGNGIITPSPKRTQQEWNDLLGMSPNQFKAGMTANLTNTKDHITLIKAWKIVIEKTGDMKPMLIFAGRFGNMLDSINKEIFDNQLYPYVKLIGPTNDVDGLNSILDLGILSSRVEGLPNCIMEQMALGLPVVGTENDGIKEAVGEENYRFLSPVGDAEKLAEKILTFVNNPLLCKEVGLKNMARIKSNFSFEKMCEEMHSIILKGLNK